MNHKKENNKPLPSSTVIILREGQKQEPELLLVRRNPNLRTSGGVWVFPGGKIDRNDYPSASSAEDTEIIAAKTAALRETHEETALQLERENLTPFAHWTTPIIAARRFATWFFISSISSDEDVIVDGEEIVDYQWLTAEKAIHLHAQHKLEITPPSFVSFHHLKKFESVSEIQDFYQKRFDSSGSYFQFNPVIIQQNDKRTILYDDDAGYAEQDCSNLAFQHRLESTTKDGKSTWNYIHPDNIHN